MSDYIKEAIVNGIFETFEMTLFASLFSYIVGMPLGVILYATSKGRILHATGWHSERRRTWPTR